MMYPNVLLCDHWCLVETIYSVSLRQSFYHPVSLSNETTLHIIFRAGGRGQQRAAGWEQISYFQAYLATFVFSL